MKRRGPIRWIARFLVWLLILATMAAMVFAIAGIPQPCLRPLLARLESEGLRATMDRARLLPWQGIVLDGVHAAPVGDPSWFFSANKLVLTVDLGSPATRVEASIADGALFAELPGEPPDAPTPSPLVVENVAGFVSWDGRRTLEFALTGLATGRARLNGSGSIALATPVPRPPDLARTSRPLAERMAEGMRPLLSRIGHHERFLRSHAKFGQIPTLALRIVLDGDRPGANRVGFDLSGAGTSVHKLPVDRWTLTGAWARERGVEARFLAAMPDARLEVLAEHTPDRAAWHGDAEFRGRLATFRSWLPPSVAKWPVPVDALPPLQASVSFDGVGANAANVALDFTVQTPPSLPEDDPFSDIHVAGAFTNGILALDRFLVRAPRLTEVLSLPWISMLDGLSVRLDGPISLEGRADPMPLGDFAQRFSANVHAEAMALRGVAFSNVSARVERNGPRVVVPRLHADLAGERLPADRSVPVAGLCDLTGRFAGDTATGEWDAALDFTARLATALPFLPSNVAAVVRTIHADEPCHASLTLRHAADQGADVSVAGRVSGRGFERNGQRVALADTSFSWANGALVFAPIHLVHEGGAVAGEAAWETARTGLHLRVTSSAAPHAVARLIGPPLTDWLAPFRVEGPAHVEASGFVDLMDSRRTHMTIGVDGERIGYGPFLAEQAVAPLTVTGSVVRVAPFAAAWCGGTVTGRIEVTYGTDATGAVCHLDLGLERGEFGKVLQALRGGTNAADYTGDLSGHLRLTGPVGEDFLRKATGGGNLRIANGDLLSVPLFGGLSRYLSILLPGLGYLSQRDFHAAFEVNNGRARTDEAYLLGNVLSMRGHGAYSFDGALDFRVEVKFLREGITATVARLLTSPLTKALEFQLTGTPDEPRWRPVNTPERLLEFFNQMLGQEKPAP